uniref:Uncharacterized mitochondrial protein AtMg00810-like n=1 Tax=Nicotiana tabacum TaxID=4097 RepID=A0A1S3XZ81_TOBAC|nr:PREDICTED: uncharacterized mitochondrial protein AtMg00810-like [Nicotiana tabacum]
MKLTEALLNMGFQQSYYDYSLFTKKAGDDIVVILVYVDDLLITGNNQQLLCSTRSDLMKNFKMKDLGELKFFLGFEFARSKRRILMYQRKYALELISESGLSGAKPAGTPLGLNQKLTSVEYDNYFKNDNIQTDESLDNPGAYQRLIGRLLYLTMTRPDIAFVVQVLSQYMHYPKRFHMEAALRVVRYIKEAPGLGLFLPAEPSNQLSAFCDSDWGDSKKQSNVSRSSTEDEFRSMALCAAEVTWLVGLFSELGVKIELHITLVCDSRAAIQIAAIQSSMKG